MTTAGALPDGLPAALRAAVGEAHVLTDPDLMAPYLTDWARRWTGTAAAVVRPGSTPEVAEVVRACVAAGVAVHPQGGNTGLVGGSVPAAAHPGGASPVVLSTSRLTRLDPVDEVMGQVTCGAGTTLGDLRRHAAAAGWEYGVDLAARDSATVGGTVATNAGGIRVVAYGMTRAQVVGIEAVLPGGDVVSHLAGLAKDNTGYDLAGLMVGSEGTLGVVTAVRLRLHRPPGPTTVVLVGVASFDEALGLVRGAVDPRSTLLAAEVVDATGMALVQQLAGLPWPLERRWPLVLLLEATDVDGGPAFSLPDDADAVAALDAADAARLWAYRERQSEAFSAHGVAHKLDVSVPLGSLGAAAALMRERLLARPDVEAFGVFGHVADGNLHAEIVGPAPDDATVDEAVLGVVRELGGSVSAEHGIGRAKTAYLSWCRSPAEIAAMRAVKAALDPAGLLAPGVLLP